MMFHYLPSRSLLNFTALLAALFACAVWQPVHGQSKERKGKSQLKLICVSSLAENQEVILASRDDHGKWKELGTTTLRSSLITDWMPATAGELHLAVREEGTLKSIAQFTCPPDSRRALVALIADPEKKVYNAHAVDPEKLEFVKGSVLIFNLSPHAGLVSLGPQEEKVEAGQQRVVKATLEGSGMYRMMVSYLDADGKTVSCYDRQASSNPNSRDMLFLVPDKTLGLRVLSLPLFGSLD
jgi:hypothetical protein